jgi:hypothetical protein
MTLHGLQSDVRWGYPSGDSFFGEPYPQNALDYEAAHPGLSAFSIFGIDTYCSMTPNPWTLIGEHPGTMHMHR